MRRRQEGGRFLRKVCTDLPTLEGNQRKKPDRRAALRSAYQTYSDPAAVTRRAGKKKPRIKNISSREKEPDSEKGKLKKCVEDDQINNNEKKE